MAVEEFQVVPKYEPRFIKPEQEAELINLWHLSRCALSGQNASRHERMLWTSREFSKLHPEITSTGVYKDLDYLNRLVA